MPPGPSEPGNGDVALLAQLERLLDSGKMDAMLQARGWQKKKTATGNGKGTGAGATGAAKSAKAAKKQQAASNNVSDGCWVTKTRTPSKPKQDAEAKEDENVVHDVLLNSNGFNVPVTTMESLSMTVGGVCLASRKFARDTIQSFANVSVPTGLLIRGGMEGVTSTEIEVSVKDPQGRVAIRKRHLVQVGMSEQRITTKVAGAKVQVAGDTTVVSVVIHKNRLKGATWANVVQKPTEAIGRWLRHRCGVEPLDVFLGRGARNPDKPDMLRVCVRLPSAQLQKLLKEGSGQDAISVWQFSDAKDAIAVKVVWLEDEASPESAMDRRKDVPHHLGVVVNPVRVGIRVPSEHFATACEILVGGDAAKRRIKDKWEVINIPDSWGRAAMESALAGIGWESA